ncbi:hypothetical protein Scep_025328 [Stephania cephalantha]|uniref:Thionin-like protein 2 n=1 Tax=Stephania cephalantha TaxID=152367 RepID=A0AAP0EIH7_9MAGN
MESKKVLVCLLLVALLSANAIHAKPAWLIGICYAVCYAPCLVKYKNPVECGVMCLRKCAVNAYGLDINNNPCHSKCVYEKCAKISTITNPHVRKVERCLKSCSNGCAKAH